MHIHPYKPTFGVTRNQVWPGVEIEGKGRVVSTEELRVRVPGKGATPKVIDEVTFDNGSKNPQIEEIEYTQGSKGLENRDLQIQRKNVSER